MKLLLLKRRQRVIVCLASIAVLITYLRRLRCKPFSAYGRSVWALALSVLRRLVLSNPQSAATSSQVDERQACLEDQGTNRRVHSKTTPETRACTKDRKRKTHRQNNSVPPHIVAPSSADTALGSAISQDDWLDARAVLQAQRVLRPKVKDTLASFPRSFLYEDEQDSSLDEMTRGFAAFLRYVRYSLRDSPRNLLLRDLCRRSAALASCGDPKRRAAVAELHVLLGEQPGAPFLRLVESFQALSPGQNYLRWRSAAKSAEKDAWHDGDSVVESRVRAGLEEKALRRGRRRPTDDELVSAVGAIRDRAGVRQAEQRNLAVKLRKKLKVDPCYQRYMRSRTLWEASGIGALWREYLLLDRKEGEARRARGGSFESAWARLLFAVVVEVLIERGVVLADDRERFAYHQNVRWVDSRKVAVGEVDLVIVRESTAVALAEMKSGIVEVAAAAQQHTGRLSAALSGAHGAPQLRTTCGQVLVPSPSMQLFVGTIVPRHRYGIGADPKLVRAAGEAVFDMRRYHTSTGVVVAPSEAEHANGAYGSLLDLDDLEPVEILRQTLRDDTALRERLRMSPLHFVSTASNLIVFEQDELEQRSVRSCPVP
eukprot:TRINITY_DN57765_c0_g1_i1.p1 TRINITY_DN57765_c0_g1~~TRINITY_DN57765_c0_g1_i1.p1  ORF type:complete len:622 (+),score=76.06 TRINITY_DN57765_c0_g1_i1:72-1868(+)